jgi:alkylation response protein AidB-like acyl-CoA dehydrogenase
MIARTLLLHERYYHGNVGYGYGGKRERSAASFYGRVHTPRELVLAAERRGLLEELTPLIADTYIESVVGPLTEYRINTGMRVGTHEGPWGSVLKLQWSVGNHQAVRAELSVLGAEAVIWDGEEVKLDNTGTTWLFSRARRIAGGSSEMQRNTISERLLGLPRDVPADLDKPFREVQSNRP